MSERKRRLAVQQHHRLKLQLNDLLSPTMTISHAFQPSKSASAASKSFKPSSSLHLLKTRPEKFRGAEFLSAMASVGFLIKKLDGSAWVFTLMGDGWKQSIIFHEPHPGTEILYRVARGLERSKEWAREFRGL